MNSYSECKAIVELDLDPIKVKLMHKESGEGWTLEQASAVETEYRRFLYLAKMFPNEPTAPSMHVDTFWHYHILDTMKYAQDCQEVFGYFLHHFPYVGLRGEDDQAAQQKAGERMAELYAQVFGEQEQLNPVKNAKSAWCIRSAGRDKTAWCMATAGRDKTAWCMSAAGTDKTAWCMATAGRDKTAWCMSAAGRDKTAWCMSATGRDKTAWCMSAAGRDKTAWCMTTEPTTAAGHAVRQDETDSPTRSGGIALPHAVATLKQTLMNSLFATRPRLPAPTQAN